MPRREQLPEDPQPKRVSSRPQEPALPAHLPGSFINRLLELH